MKGHMQDGKFHPHSEYKKGTRKSRDQQAKTQGIRLKHNSTKSLREDEAIITDKQSHDIQNRIDLVMDKTKDEKLLKELEDIRDSIPCSCERKARYVREVGNIVMVSPDNDNENYDSFRGKKLRIVNVTTSSDQHPAFDEGMAGEGLYDLETLDGELVGNALYDYELVNA